MQTEEVQAFSVEVWQRYNSTVLAALSQLHPSSKNGYCSKQEEGDGTTFERVVACCQVVQVRCMQPISGATITSRPTPHLIPIQRSQLVPNDVAQQEARVYLQAR